MIKPSHLTSRLDFASYLNKNGLTGSAVEVGTQRGVFASAFLKEWKGAQFTCIDPWKSYLEYAWQVKYLVAHKSWTDDFVEAVSSIRAASKINNQVVTFLQKTSADAVGRFEDNSLDFVYIDANHHKDYVLQDLRLWWPKVKPGGILAGHDVVCWFVEGMMAEQNWGISVQWALHQFLSGINNPPDLYIVIEQRDGTPWSYYLEKP